MGRLAVGIVLSVLAPVAPALAQSATQPPATNPMVKSVERAREAKDHWLDTARATSPFQPKGDQRWPPPPTPPPDLYRATPETYAARDAYTPRDTPYRPPLQSAPLSTSYSYRSPAASEPYYPSAARFYAPPRYVEPLRPGNVDVFVDNRLYGTVDSVSRMGGLHLSPGVHRVDLRAVGFNSAAYNVAVGLPQPHYYRPVSVYNSGLFVPVVAAPYGYASYPSYVSYPSYASYPTFNSWPIGPFGVPRPQRAPRSVYVVSRCYAGDEPPKDYQLPAGCTGPATPAR
ncbi:MAG TPA: hypothetical protein VGQ37_02285 [Vicinamibacterales bacterium]|nr:hypothetical protein [Vicinamibacterales bacterium]